MVNGAPPALLATLSMIAEAAAGAADPWWIIGSAAVALHDAKANPRDVDLLMSAADAAALLARLGQEARPGTPDARFRSAIFGRWAAPPVPVDVMGDLHLMTDGGWRAVAPTTREPVAVGEGRVFVPSLAEMRQLLRCFGRPKDLERLRLLAAM